MCDNKRWIVRACVPTNVGLSGHWLFESFINKKFLVLHVFQFCEPTDDGKSQANGGPVTNASWQPSFLKEFETHRKGRQFVGLE